MRLFLLTVTVVLASFTTFAAGPQDYYFLENGETVLELETFDMCEVRIESEVGSGNSAAKMERLVDAQGNSLGRIGILGIYETYQIKMSTEGRLSITFLDSNNKPVCSIEAERNGTQIEKQGTWIEYTEKVNFCNNDRFPVTASQKKFPVQLKLGCDESVLN